MCIRDSSRASSIENIGVFAPSGALVLVYLGNWCRAAAIQMCIRDSEYYEPRAIGEDTCIVFGTLWARERPDRPKPLLVEMDTRFTLVFRREDVYKRQPPLLTGPPAWKPGAHPSAACPHTCRRTCRAVLLAINDLANRHALGDHCDAAPQHEHGYEQRE